MACEPRIEASWDRAKEVLCNEPEGWDTLSILHFWSHLEFKKVLWKDLLIYTNGFPILWIQSYDSKMVHLNGSKGWWVTSLIIGRDPYAQGKGKYLKDRDNFLLLS